MQVVYSRLLISSNFVGRCYSHIDCFAAFNVRLGWGKLLDDASQNWEEISNENKTRIIISPILKYFPLV